jgi:GAF domain-containing protein
MSDPARAAAAAAAVLPTEEQHRALLQSIVEAARAIFSARAASIFLHDDEADELVFEAAAGERSGDVIGLRLPAGTGIAGWVLATRQPLVLNDLANDPRFAREVAERTGFVPSALMAVPLLSNEQALGVLQVLDPEEDVRSGLAQMELIGLFANQAAVALDLLRGARRARAAIEGGGGDLADVTALAAAVDALEGERHEAGLALVRALAQVLRR